MICLNLPSAVNFSMTKTILSVLFLTTIMMTAAIAASVDVIESADAIKGKGVGTSKYGSATDICGLQLCSEIPGGKAAWIAEQGQTTPTVEEETTEETMKESAEQTVELEEEITMDETMMDKPMMEETTMKKDIAHGWNAATGTLTSVTDPGLGHESHQLAIILPPSDNAYKGILSYDASEPIQLVALHGPLADGEDKGQAIWTPDGETKFALTFIDNESAMGTWLFSGNALAVHTMNEDEFTVSYSVSYMEKSSSDTVSTATISSMTDPGLGHESHQLAIILPPSDKTYSGLLTYSASEPIQLVALHGPLADGEDKGQAIWTPDGETKFALTFVDNESAMGTWLFAGNALAVHTMNEDEFTISYSVVAGQ